MMGGRGTASGFGGGGSTQGGVNFVPTPSEYNHMTDAARTAYIQAMPLGQPLQIESKSGNGNLATVIKQPGAQVGHSYYTIDYNTPGGHVHFEVDTPSKVRQRLKSNGFKG